MAVQIPEKYKILKNEGNSAEAIADLLYEDGIIGIERMSIIKQLFDFDIKQTKETIIHADGLANSLDEYQRRLIPNIIQAFEIFENEETTE